jgi:hypothetical protein
VSAVIVKAAVLEEARAYFEERGAYGCEGTAMIIATGSASADRLIVPEQQASPVPKCWVEVTRTGKLQLAAALGPDDRYVARIHSHPGLAFHSLADDANPALTFEGAISIVVPYFGLGLRRGLATCAVFVRRGMSWVELPAGPVRDQVVVAP